MKRVKTGIPGLDSLVEGGLVGGSSVLLSGPAGSGKTVFGLQFLCTGASTYDEPGVFVTLESRPDELRAEALQFNWDIEKLEQEKAFVLIDAASSKAGLPTSENHALRRGFDLSALAQEIYDAVEEVRANRVVIDSLSALNIDFDETSNVRKEIYKLSALLRELGVTSVLVCDTVSPNTLSRIGVEEFVTQGLILLGLDVANDKLNRNLLIWKMRRTAHSMKKHRFVISENGIKVEM
ncbi:MAG: AAA family ATPase [Candidatus Thorarchaeota archaeon]|nr:AAA family ATPase [Candidatus Thorarchaeota archaeon]